MVHQAEAGAKREVVHVPGVDHGPGLSAGVKAGGLVFFAGIRGRGDDMKSQARAAFESLKNHLAGAGSTLDDVVKVTVYFQDIDERAPFHEVWMEYLGNCTPARTTAQVANASTRSGGNSRFILDVVAVAHS